MATETPDAVLDQWSLWIQQRSGSSPEVALEGRKRAIEALDRGAGLSTAGLVGVLAAGGQAGQLVAEVSAERTRSDAALAELSTIRPAGQLTASAIEELRSIFNARVREATLALASVQAVRPSTPQPVAAGVPIVAPVRPAAPRKPVRLVLQEFLRDQSILIVAYTGAFLLIVATVLFELYGVSGKEGWIRFGAVFLLDLVFAAAGWATLRSSRLRIVGQAYIAIAALMAPLAFAAAYIFLDLQRSLSVNAALAITGISCSVLYGVLAARLRSQGYAVLAMLAFPAGWVGGLNELKLEAWWGAGFAPLALGYFVLAHWIQLSMPAFGRVVQIANVMGHAAAGVSIAAAGALPTTFTATASTAAAVFGALTLAYGTRFAFVATRGRAVLMLLAFGLTWLWLVIALDLREWSGPALVPLIAIYASLAASRTPLPRRELLAAANTVPLHLATAAATVAALQVPAAWPLVITFAGIGTVYATRQAVGLGDRYSPGIAVGGMSAAWIAAVASWPVGDWTPAAVAALAVALVAITLARRPQWLSAFRRPATLQAYGAGGLAALLAANWYAGSGPTWPLMVAFLVLAAGYAGQAWRLRTTASAWFAAAAFSGAWAAAIVPAGIPDPARALAMAPAATVFVLAAFVARRRADLAPFARPAAVFVHVTAVSALIWSPHLFTASGEIRPDWGYTAALGAVTFAYALSLLLNRSPEWSWAPALGVTATSLAAAASAGLGDVGFAATLTALAWMYAISWTLVKQHPVRHFFLAGATVQAFSVAGLEVQPDWLMASLLIISTAALIALVRWSRDFRLVFLPAVLGADAWFWCVKAIVPPPAHPAASDLVRAYVGLPIVYGAIGLGLRSRLAVRWAAPVYITGAAAAVAVAVGAVGLGDLALAGWALLAYAVVAYTVGAVERWWWGAAASAVAALAGVLILLLGADAAVAWYPVAGSAGAIVLYGGSLVWSSIGSRGRYWSEVHTYGALALAAISTLSCFAVPDFWLAGSNATLAAAGSALTLAALAAVMARRQGLVVLEYGSIFAASLIAFWILRRFNVDVPHWLVMPSALALIAIGVRLSADQRLATPHRMPDALIVAGATLLAGSALLETATSTDQAWLYTVIVVVEGILGLLAGIALRSRIAVVSFAAAIALGAIRALFLVIQALPLWLVIGILAVVLLAAAAALALLRDRLSRGLHRLA